MIHAVGDRKEFIQARHLEDACDHASRSNEYHLAVECVVSLEESPHATGIEEVQVLAINDQVRCGVPIACIASGRANLVDAGNVYLAGESNCDATTVRDAVDLQVSGIGFVAQETPSTELWRSLATTPGGRDAGLEQVGGGYPSEH
ncbi:MAG: hypothetical protein WEA76_01345 [Acidimicrobiia bacterium]